MIYQLIYINDIKYIMYIIYFILYIINIYQLVYHMMNLLQYCCVETFWLLSLSLTLTFTCRSGRGAFGPKNMGITLVRAMYSVNN